jgi:hypothetical protein
VSNDCACCPATRTIVSGARHCSPSQSLACYV